MLALLKRIIKNKNKAIEASGRNSGFTLIELLVVLGIFALIMGVAMFNQAGLSSNVLITNLAYETALAVREAQTYGISVKSTASSSAIANFNMGYGAYFNINTSDQVIVFGDSNDDHTYTSDAIPSEVQSLYKIQNQRGNRIVAICANSFTPPCSSEKSLKRLSIMFKRPNPESNFYAFDENGAPIGGNGGSVVGPAVIVVNNALNSNCRAIVVETTGQIRVENSGGGNCVNQ